MKSKYSILLVVLTAICFVMAALEVNTEHIKNTFGDQYDSYVQPDNPTHHSVVKIVHNFFPGYISVPESIASLKATLTGYVSVNRLTASFNSIICKRFILNLELLI